MIGLHSWQYASGNSPITRSSGCTWVTGATGVAVVTGGRYTPSPDKIHSLVKRWEETNKETPGWSLDDLKLALLRFGAMRFEDKTGQGWAAVEDAVEAQRRFVVIQGDSDQFPAGCSGAFDGDHCIGVDGSKGVKVEDGVEHWWLHDPICPTGRWERKAVIRRYAEKLLKTIRFGWFVAKPPVGEWVWQYDPPKRGSFAVFTVQGEPGSDGRITSVRRVSTRATSLYRCSEPSEPTPWPGHRPVRLVRLGKLASGQPGPHTGAYVNARYAHQED